MERIEIGHTGLIINRNGFGALPIQRIETGNVVSLLRKALASGIDYYDTARAYSDSEEKLGLAFEGCRERVVISTKTGAADPGALRKDLDASLRMLQTDHIDLYQLHNPSFCPKPGDGSGLYEELLEQKAKGRILHIGITNHRLSVANEAVESGLYETLQFPFSYLASREEISLMEKTIRSGMGFIAMKGLSGGLLRNSAAAYAYIMQFPGVIPIWGIQKESELDEFVRHQNEPPKLTDELTEVIREDREQLSGDFCRGCGYCMPCPARIQINMCARMSLFLRRAPVEGLITEHWQREMARVEDCRHCLACSRKCPYHLDTPALLKKNYEDYREFLRCRAEA